MLRTRDLLRSNGLNLLPCQEVLLHDSALPFDIPEFAQQSYDSTKASNKSSGISTDLQMAVTEISSGLSRQVIRFPDVLTNSSRGPSLVHSTEYLINYDEGSGLHRIYTLATGEFMGQVKKLSGLNQKISRAVASKLNAGMFFFVSEDNSMHTVLIQPKSKAPIKISPMYKLDKAIPANVDRPKGKVESLLSHPTLPLLFVLYNDGSTYIWSYETLFRRMSSSQFAGGNKSAAGNSGDGEGDDFNAVDEANDDEAEGNKIGTAAKTKKAADSTLNLQYVGKFSLPSSASLEKLADNFSNIALFPLSIDIQKDGKQAAICFCNMPNQEKSVILLYDLAKLFKKGDQSIVISPFAALPLSNANVGSVERKFQFIAFHPHLPLLFVCVTKRKVMMRSERSMNGGVSTRRVGESSSFTMPLPPEIYAVSLNVPSRNVANETGSLFALTCIDGYELSNVDIEGLNTTRSSLSLQPTRFYISPTSGLLCLTFRFYCQLNPSVIYNKDILKQSFTVTLETTDSWIKKSGLAIYAKTIANTISVSPETFLFGLSALSSKAFFTRKADNGTHTVNPFTCAIKDTPSPSANSGDSATKQLGFPRLFTIRRRLATFLAYDVLEIDWMQRQNISNDNATSAEGGMEGTHAARKFHSLSAAYVDAIPGELNNDMVKAFIANTYKKWCKLDQEDYLKIPFTTAMDDLMQKGVNSADTISESFRKKLTSIPDGTKDISYQFFPQEVAFFDSKDSKIAESADLSTLWKTGLVCVHGIVRKIYDNNMHVNQDVAILQDRDLSNTMPVVFLMNNEPKEDSKDIVNGTFLTYRSVQFVDQGKEPFLLCLQTTGKLLKILQTAYKPNATGQNIEYLVTKASIVLDQGIDRVWVSPYLTSKSDKQRVIKHAAVFVSYEQILPGSKTELGVPRPSGRNQLILTTDIVHMLTNQETGNWKTGCSLATSSSIEESPVHVFELQPFEHVIELSWCTQRLLQDDKQQPVSELMELLSALTSQGSGTDFRFAILTNFRVVVFNAALKVVVSVQHSTDKRSGSASQASHHALQFQAKMLHRAGNHRPSPQSLKQNHWRVSEKILGIQWLANALLLTFESGAIKYLIPIADENKNQLFPQHDKLNFSVWKQLMTLHRAHGLHFSMVASKSAVTELHNLITLPKNLSSTVAGSHLLSAIFPDRALVLYEEKPVDGKLNISEISALAASLCPINPVEPLLMSLHYNQHSIAKDSWLQLVSMIAAYYCPSQDSNNLFSANRNRVPEFVASKQFMLVATEGFIDKGNSQGNQILPSASSKCAEELATALTVMEDCTHRKGRHASGSFSCGRWLSASVRAGIYFQMHQPSIAISEVLTETRPGLVEVFAGHETFAGTQMPLYCSSLSNRLKSFAAYLLRISPENDVHHNEFPIALKLLDIAASYDQLLTALDKSTANGKAKELALQLFDEREKVTHAALRTVYQTLNKHLDRGGKNEEILKHLEDIYSYKAVSNVNNLSTSVRTRTLHSSLQELFAKIASMEGSIGSKEVYEALDKLDKFRVLTTSQQRGILGPAPSSSSIDSSSHVGAYGWDLLEDMVACNPRLEIIPLQSSSSANIPTADNAAKAVFFPDQELPETWVSGVGQGRELDMVSAYYRFSDVYTTQDSDPKHFHCVSSPYNFAVFVDLSKFEGPGLEVFSKPPNKPFKVDYSQSNVNPGERHESVKLLCDFINEGSSSVSSNVVQQGLRCIVFRGSQLDTGLYHFDATRKKFTLEMHVCFEGNRDQWRVYLQQSKEIVLAQRSGYDEQQNKREMSNIWKLFVNSEGFLCISMHPKDADILVSSFSIFNTNESSSEREDNFDTPIFHHIVLCIDSTNSNVSSAKASNPNKRDASDFLIKSSPVQVALYVNESVVLDQKEASISDCFESTLARSLFFLMPDACLPYRLTEVRLWADRRSQFAIQQQKEVYLGLAEKRVRLQMQLKGSKKLFSAFKEISFESHSSAAKLIFPTGSSEGTNSATAVNVASPAFPKLLSAPGAKLGAPSLLSAPPTSNASESGTVLTAKQKRMSMLQSPPAILAKPAPAEFGKDDVKRDSVDAHFPLVESVSFDTPAKDVVENSSFAADPFTASDPFAKRVEDNNRKQGDDLFANDPFANNSFSSSASSDPFAKPASFDHAAKPSSSLATSVSAAKLSTSQPVQVATASFQNESFRLEGMHFDPLNLLDWDQVTFRNRVLIPPFCLTQLQPSLTTPQLQVLFYGGAGGVNLQNQFHEIHIDIPSWIIKADEVQNSSVITCQRLVASSPFIFAVYSNKSIAVYDGSTYLGVTEPDAEKKLVKLTATPMSVPLCYFTYMSSELMALVTNVEGFTWKTTLTQNPGNISKPIKIFSRVDLEEPQRWQERKVCDLMLTKEKWTMLLTRNCTVPVPNPPSVEWIESAKVNLSLHHAVSHKAISFKAIAGCFRPGHVLLFWLIPSEANGLMEWKVTAVDLEEMLKFSTARQTAQYIPPMEFEDLGVSASPDNNKLPIMWSLTLGHEDKSQPFNAASTLLFPLVIADRLFVFTQSASVYLATLPSATVSSAKLNGKCSLPLLGGDQFSKTVLGVLTDSNAPTSNPSVLCLGMTADESSQRIFSIIRVNLKDIAVRIKSNAVPGK